MLFIFIFLVLTIFATIGFCAWIIWKEPQKADSAAEPETEKSAPSAPSQTNPLITKIQGLVSGLKPKQGAAAIESPSDSEDEQSTMKSGLSQLMNKFNISGLGDKFKSKKTPSDQDNAKGTADLRLGDVFSKEAPQEDQVENTEPPEAEAAPPSDAAADVRARPEPAPEPPPSTEAEKEGGSQIGPSDSAPEIEHPESADIIQKSRELEKKIADLEQQNNQLDMLFKEKSQALQETEESLNSEMEARKEFNKVKDLLDKELKDSKDRCRDLEIALANAEAESKSHLARIKQLEEKIGRAEQDLSEKKKALSDTQRDENQSKESSDEMGQRLDAVQQEIRAKDQKIHDLVDHFKETSANEASAHKREEKTEGSPEPTPGLSEDKPDPAVSQEAPPESETGISQIDTTSEDDSAESVESEQRQPPAEPPEQSVQQKTDQPSGSVYVRPPDAAEESSTKDMAAEAPTDSSDEQKPPEQTKTDDEQAEQTEPEGDDTVSLAPDILSNIREPEDEDQPEDENDPVEPEPVPKKESSGQESLPSKSGPDIDPDIQMDQESKTIKKEETLPFEEQDKKDPQSDTPKNLPDNPAESSESSDPDKQDPDKT